MVCWVLWVSPLGIASLISMSIVKACDLFQTLVGLGLWVLTVLIGLAIFAGVVLPVLLWVLTRSSPLKFVKTFSKALVMAFGTSSSSAALPVSLTYPPIPPSSLLPAIHTFSIKSMISPLRIQGTQNSVTDFPRPSFQSNGMQFGAMIKSDLL